MDIRVITFFGLVFGVVHCKLMKLSCKDISKIVDYHNSIRLRVAKGKLEGQPAASFMNSVVWDEDLAKKAEGWTENGIYRHNPIPDDRSGRFEVGESLFMISTSADNKDFDFDLDIALNAWSDEHKDYKFTPIPTKEKEGDKKIGHYTQMVWADTIYIGCALSKFIKDGNQEYFIVCNYGPGGNFQGQVPYKTGPPSGRLECGTEDCSKPYGPLC